jgi:hypothetical protein
LVRATLDGSSRKGILSHASFLSVHGDANMSSPVKRGAFVRERLLCQHLTPPPPGLKIIPPTPTKTNTTRELFDAHTSSPSCSGCHNLIDPIGNGFEAFDGEGHFRTTENGQAIDASGDVTQTHDADGKFDGLSELADRLAQSDDVRQCFGKNLLRFGTGSSGDLLEQELVNELPAPMPGAYAELVVAFVRAPMFIQRLAP